MDSKDIYDGVTDIRDDLIDGAMSAPKRQKPRKRAWQTCAVAAVLVLAVIGGIILNPGNSGAGITAYALAEAEYPKMAPYPGEPHTEKQYDTWWDDVRAQRRDLGDVSPLLAFFQTSSAVFLSDTAGQNKVYSPLNVYMALSMLAQITGGDSRGQILALLGSGGMDELRRQASDVWNSNYRDDGALTSVLANSLWLNENVGFDQRTADILASDFYASSYRGEMGSDDFNKELREWLDRQTGGLLKEQAEGITMDPRTVLALASTVYYRAKWANEFSKSATAPQTFHSPAGDVETDFMHQRNAQSYYWGGKFSAVSQSFREGGSMWFLLPDEGVTPEELLSDSEAMDFLFSGGDWENSKYLFVNKSIPKFDVVSQFDLADGLMTMGVTDVFDPSLADFTPTVTDVPVFVSEANHASRVTIDEEGCTAAAFTVMMGNGAGGPPDDEVDFVLDRPFIFCITGDSGLPLFVGIVNEP